MARTQVDSANFTAADNTTIDSYRSDWLRIRGNSVGPGYLGITSNKANNLYSQALTAFRAAGTFGADQYSKVTIGGFLNNANFVSVMVRSSTDLDSAADYYQLEVKDVATPITRLCKCINGTETDLDTRTSIAWANGDTMSLEAIGTSPSTILIVYRNDVEVYRVTGNNDSALDSGKPAWGLFCGSSHTLTVDDFDAGTVAGDTTPPTLTSPTGTQTGSTTGSGTVTTDEANGTLYSLATTNATETAATVKASGATQSISSTGSKSVSFTGLTPSTTYYAHYVHRDAAGNDSTVADSASFTTTAPPSTGVAASTVRTQMGRFTYGKR